MGCLQFIAADLSSYTFTSSEPAQAGFPLTNLYTYFVDDRFVSSNDNPNQSLTIDFGVSKLCDTLICHNMNFAHIMVSGTILLQTSPDNSTWSTVRTLTTTETLTAYQFSATASRYWRIYYNGELGGAPYLGNVFLEKALVPQFGYDWNFKTENLLFETTNNVMVDGRSRPSLVRDGRLISDIDLPEQHASFTTDFQTFYRTIQGRAKPFYMLDGDTLRYMHLDRDLSDITVKSFGQQKINRLHLKTQVTGLLPADMAPKTLYLIYEDEIITSLS